MKFDRIVEKMQLFSCFIEFEHAAILEFKQQKVPTAQTQWGLCKLELKLGSLFDRSSNDDLSNLTSGEDCIRQLNGAGRARPITIAGRRRGWEGQHGSNTADTRIIIKSGCRRRGQRG